MAQSTRLRPIAEGDLGQIFGDQAPPPPGFEYPAEHSGNLPQNPANRGRIENAATTLLLTSLRALSQRSLIALANLFVLLTAASAFFLWLQILPNPSVYQIIAVSIYGGLLLVLDWMVLRRR